MLAICSHFNIFGNMVPMILILKKKRNGDTMVINHDMRFRNARPYWKQQKMQETSLVVGCQPVSCTGAEVSEGGRKHH